MGFGVYFTLGMLHLPTLEALRVEVRVACRRVWSPGLPSPGSRSLTLADLSAQHGGIQAPSLLHAQTFLGKMPSCSASRLWEFLAAWDTKVPALEAQGRSKDE